MVDTIKKEKKDVLVVENQQLRFMFNMDKVKILERAYNVQAIDVATALGNSKLPKMSELESLFVVGLQDEPQSVRTKLFESAVQEHGYVTLTSFLMELLTEDLGFMFR